MNYEYNDNLLLSKVQGVAVSGEIISEYMFTYNSVGQLIVEQRPEMSQTTYTYDVYVNVIAIEMAGGSRYTYERNSRNMRIFANDQVCCSMCKRISCHSKINSKYVSFLRVYVLWCQVL